MNQWREDNTRHLGSTAHRLNEINSRYRPSLGPAFNEERYYHHESAFDDDIDPLEDEEPPKKMELPKNKKISKLCNSCQLNATCKIQVGIFVDTCGKFQSQIFR